MFENRHYEWCDAVSLRRMAKKIPTYDEIYTAVGVAAVRENRYTTIVQKETYGAMVAK